jgi:hypothetical protein
MQEPTDPVSRELARTVRDLRNAEVVSRLTQGPPPPEEEAERRGLAKVVEMAVEKLLSKAEQADQRPTSSEVSQAVREAVEQYGAVAALRELKRLAEPQPSEPRPETSDQLLRMATGAAEIHRAAAETAMREREAYENRLRDLMATRDREIQQAKQESEAQAKTLLELVKETLENQHRLNLEVQKREYESSLSSLEKRIEEIEKRYEEKFRQLTAEYQTKLAIEQERHKHELEKLQLQNQIQKLQEQIPKAQTPEEIIQRGYAEEYVRGLREQREAQKREAEARAGLVEDVRKLVQQHGPDLVRLVDKGLSIAGARPNGAEVIPDLPPPPAPATERETEVVH